MPNGPCASGYQECKGTNISILIKMYWAPTKGLTWLMPTTGGSLDHPYLTAAETEIRRGLEEAEGLP